MQDTRRWVEWCTIGCACLWAATSYAQAAFFSPSSEESDKFIFAPSTALLMQFMVATLLNAQQEQLPNEWKKASRTCSDAGLLYACFPSLVLLSLLCGTIKDLGQNFRLLSLLFWTSCALFARWAIQAFCNTKQGITEQLGAIPIDVVDPPLALAGVWLWAGTGRALRHPVMVVPAAMASFKVLPVLSAFAFIFVACRLRAATSNIWLVAFPKSFTPGEAVIVGHLVSIALTDYLMFSIHFFLSRVLGADFSNARSDLNIVLQGGVLGVLCLAAVLREFFKQHAVTSNETLDVNPREQASGLLARRRSQDWTPLDSPPLRATLYFYGMTAMWLGIEVSAWVAALLGMRHPVVWVMDFTVARQANVWVLFYWTGCLAVGLPLIHWIAGNLEWPLIITRKLYHLLALIMFGPASVLVPDFTSLSFGIALAVLLVVEYIRICRVPPFGFLAHKYLRSYTDSRDEGTTILTHIYLLLGCSVPLWLFPWQADFGTPFACLGGLVVLGAGDAAGAIVGSTCGKVFLPGGRKTLEGSLSAVVATLLSLFVLTAWQGAITNHSLQVILATVLTCILEAFTKQIDNLTLPLFFSSLLYLP